MRIIALISWLVLILSGLAHAQPVIGEQLLEGTTAELLGETAAFENRQVVSPERAIVWNAYVPTDYDPSNPPGIMVYISPTPSGRMPTGYQPIMDRKNLIWVSAEESGNSVQTAKRVLYAVTGLGAVQRNYAIDPDRIYISGFSGGGRTASIAATLFPQLFDGAVFICGVNELEPAGDEALDLIRENRFVFLTGRDDFNRQDTRRIYRQYLAKGAENSLLMDLSYLDHSLPRGVDLEKAISFLDERGGEIPQTGEAGGQR